MPDTFAHRAAFRAVVTLMCKGWRLTSNVAVPMTKKILTPLARPVLAALVLLVVSLSPPAVADDGWLYLSANVGTTLSTYSRSDLNNELIALDDGQLTLESSSVDKPKAPWSVNVGYMVSPYFGVAVSYLDLQTLKYRAAGTQVPPTGSTSPVSAKVDITSRGPTLALVGVLPLWNAWRVSGQAGVYVSKTSTNYSTAIGSDTNSGSESTTAGSPLLGVGGSYSLTPHCALRLDYLYVKGVHETALNKSFNVSLLTAGFEYAF